MLTRIQDPTIRVAHADEVSRVVVDEVTIAAFSEATHGARYRDVAETHARAIRRRGYITGVAYPAPRGTSLPAPKRSKRDRLR